MASLFYFFLILIFLYGGCYGDRQLLLLHAPECVDILSVTNETPLFFAVKSNSANCVKLLLQFGANRDALNLR